MFIVLTILLPVAKLFSPCILSDIRYLAGIIRFSTDCLYMNGSMFHVWRLIGCSSRSLYIYSMVLLCFMWFNRALVVSNLFEWRSLVKLYYHVSECLTIRVGMWRSIEALMSHGESWSLIMMIKIMVRRKRRTGTTTYFRTALCDNWVYKKWWWQENKIFAILTSSILENVFFCKFETASTKNPKNKSVSTSNQN